MSDQIEHGLLALGAGWRIDVSQALRTRVALIGHGAEDVTAAVVPAVSTRGWRSPFMAAVGFAIGVVGLLVFPGARVTVARQAVRVLQALRVGPNTQLQTDDVRSRGEVEATLRETGQQLATGKSWFVSTVYGGFGGSVRAGASSDVQTIKRSDVLLSLAAMPLLGPDMVYRGERLTFHHALLAPDGFVLAFFGHGATEVLLVQAPVGHGHSVAYSRVVSGTDGRIIGVAPAVETLTLNGQQLTWDPDPTGTMTDNSALRWEANEISYSLYGRALMRDEALALFSSLRPLQ
jgi:hypothetical protein